MNGKTTQFEQNIMNTFSSWVAKYPIQTHGAIHTILSAKTEAGGVPYDCLMDHIIDVYEKHMPAEDFKTLMPALEKIRDGHLELQEAILAVCVRRDPNYKPHFGVIDVDNRPEAVSPPGANRIFRENGGDKFGKI